MRELDMFNHRYQMRPAESNLLNQIMIIFYILFSAVTVENDPGDDAGFIVVVIIMFRLATQGRRCASALES